MLKGRPSSICLNHLLVFLVTSSCAWVLFCLFFFISRRSNKTLCHISMNWFGRGENQERYHSQVISGCMTPFVLEPIHPQEGAGPVCGSSHYSSSIRLVPTMPVSHEGDIPLFPCDHSGNSSNSIVLLWLCFVTDNHSLCGWSTNGDGHEAGEKRVWKAILLLHLNAVPQYNINCSRCCELGKKNVTKKKPG